MCVKRSDNQKLVDIMFQIGLTIHANDNEWLDGKSTEEIATWIASQLRQCGFDTVPVGSLWGKLVNDAS